MGVSLPPGQPSQPQSAKLTEDEQKLVARLLSDATYFPVEFKAWIKNFIESSGITLPASQVKGGGPGSRTGLAAGIIVAFPSATMPPDALFCDGAAIVRSDFQKLFDIIGTTWGAGDGVSTFNIPDLRDRTLFCIGSKITMAQTDGVTAGSRGGPEHHHDIAQTTDDGGGHSHGISTDSVGDHSHGFAAGSVQAINAADSILAIPQTFGGGSYITSGAGGHSHGGGTDFEPAHDHFLSGPTSGGYLSNKFSFAGVKYGITTGL